MNKTPLENRIWSYFREGSYSIFFISWMGSYSWEDLIFERGPYFRQNTVYSRCHKYVVTSIFVITFQLNVMVAWLVHHLKARPIVIKMTYYWAFYDLYFQRWPHHFKMTIVQVPILKPLRFCSMHNLKGYNVLIANFFSNLSHL